MRSSRKVCWRGCRFLSKWENNWLFMIQFLERWLMRQRIN